MLKFLGILNEVQHSYHSLIIVRLYFIFTAQNLNSFKCYIPGYFFLTGVRSHWFLQGHMATNNETVPANNAVLGLSEEMGMSKSKRWWEGKILLFFSFPFRFLLSLALLDNQIEYPENHRERLRTREVNYMMMMKSSNIFKGRHWNTRWRNTSSVQNHF